MSIKAARPGGAMTGTTSAGLSRRPVLSWLANKREAERLWGARKKAGLTRQQLADRMGVKKAWIQYRETRRTPLTADEVTRIEQAIKQASAEAAEAGVTS